MSKLLSDIRGELTAGVVFLALGIGVLATYVAPAVEVGAKATYTVVSYPVRHPVKTLKAPLTFVKKIF